MWVLGIESSCDETAAAVVDGALRLKTNIVSTQVATHAPFGGVVPEVASREHALRVVEVVKQATRPIGGLSALDGIAVTAGPGLVGALLVGLQYAKGLAFGLDVPFVAINHLEGHLAACLLSQPTPPYPHVALLVSGGHTQLYHVRAFGKYELLGTTRDDAAGEAFDKIAKLLGLGYPGGAAMEAAARGGDPEAIPFPRAKLSQPLDFSFSGLKTAASNRLRAVGGQASLSAAARQEFCASFQAAIVDTLVEKTMAAARAMRCQHIALGGGVSANGVLREQLTARARTEGCTVYLPPRALCTDNAAMVAAAGVVRLQRKECSPFNFSPRARWPLGDRPDALAETSALL